MHWRNVALSTPHPWDNILSIERLSYSANERIGFPRLVEKFRERSGTLPIYIVISLPFHVVTPGPTHSMDGSRGPGIDYPDTIIQSLRLSSAIIHAHRTLFLYLPTFNLPALEKHNVRSYDPTQLSGTI